jgi:alpha-N-arabinofuranosidase
MFALYSGNVVLPATLATSGGSQVFQSVTQDSVSGTIFLKLVNCAGSPQPLQVTLSGLTKLAPQARAVVLSSNSPQDTNTLTDPTHVVPRIRTLTGIGPSFNYSLPPYSITVIQLQTGDVTTRNP